MTAPARDYVMELKRRFGPLDASDDELRILLAGPGGDAYRTLVDAAAFAERLYSGQDELQVAMLNLHSGVLAWGSDLFTGGGLRMLQSASVRFGARGLTAAGAIEMFETYQSLKDLADAPHLVRQFQDIVLAARHREILQMYSSERLSGSDEGTAWSDTGELLQGIGDGAGVLGALAEHFGIDVESYPSLVERHYQLGRLSLDPEKIESVRLALDATVQLLRAYRSTKNEFAHLLAGFERLQVVNSGPQGLRVTYLSGSAVVGFAQLDPGANSEIGLDTQWSDVTDVLIELDTIGSWKVGFDAYSVASYADPIATSGEGIDRTFVVPRVLRSHGGSPHEVSVGWTFGGAPDAVTRPGEQVTRTFHCPGTYTVTAKASSPSLPTIDRSTTVTVADPWRATIHTEPGGVALPNTPVTFSIGGDIPSGVTYSWNFGGGDTATSRTAVRSFASEGPRAVSLTLTDPVTRCVRTLTTTVMVGVVTRYLPQTISSLLSLEPGFVYLTSSSGTQVTARGRLVIPGGTVVKGDGGLFANGGRIDIQGTPDSPVILTSARDSTIGGNTSCACPTSGWVLQAYSSGSVNASHAEIRNAAIYGNGGTFTLTDVKLVGSFAESTSYGAPGWDSTGLRLEDSATSTSALSLRGGSHRLIDTSASGSVTPVRVIDGYGTVIDGLTAPAAKGVVSLTASSVGGVTLRRLSGAPGAVIGVSAGRYPRRVALLANVDLPYFLARSSYEWHLVPEEGRLQLLPGVRLHVDSGVTVNGALDAVGSADRPIRIIGLNSPAIRVGSPVGTDELVLEHASVTSAAVTVSGNARVALTDVTFASTPLTVDHGATLTTRSLTVDGALLRLNGGIHSLRETTLARTSTGLWLEGGAVAAVDGLTTISVATPVFMEPSSSKSTFTRLVGDAGAALHVRTGRYAGGVTAWTATDWPYRVRAAMYERHEVPQGSTLRLGPGVRVFAENTPFYVTGGGLELLGAADRPTSISALPGTVWYGVALTNGSFAASHATVTGMPLTAIGSTVALSDVTLDSSPLTAESAAGAAIGATLQRVDVRGAGVTLRGGTHDLRDVSLTDPVGGSGLNLESHADATVDGLAVTRATVHMTPTAAGSRFSRLTGPAGSALVVGPGAYRSGTTELTATEWPYVLSGSSSGSHVVPVGATLRLGPGVRALAQTRVAVTGGRLELAGTRDRTTALNAYGPGWAGLSVSTPGSVRGSVDSNNALIGGRLDLVNADATVTRTKLAGLDARSSAVAKIRYSALTASVTADGTSAVDAVTNWWGATSGPSPTGTGSSVSTRVAFDPWCRAEDCSDHDPEADRDPPVVVGHPDRAPSEAGVYDGPVTVRWTATDGGRELPAPPPVVATDEGANQKLFSTEVCDPRGNCAVGTYVLSIDLTRPTIRAITVPEPNDAGWNRGDVTVRFECDDAVSAVVVCPQPVTVTGSGLTRLSGTARDAAEHVATVEHDVRIDRAAPAIVTSGPADGDTVRSSAFNPPTCVAHDTGSGLAADCAVVTNVSPGSPGQLIYNAIASARDVAGNQSEREWSFTVVTDEDAPAVEAVADRDPNVNGWYGSSVTVRFHCSDASGVAECPEPVVFDRDGGAQSARVRAVDVHGNDTYYTVTGINVDLVPPDVRLTGAERFTIDDQIDIDCVVADSLSGIQTSTCRKVSVPALEVGVGVHSVMATATDLAGHTTSATHSFTVEVTIASMATIIDTFVGADSGASRSMRATLDEERFDAFRRQLEAFCCSEEVRHAGARPLSRREAETLRDLVDELERSR